MESLNSHKKTITILMEVMLGQLVCKACLGINLMNIIMIFYLIYENCVGTNLVFINTRREHDIDKKILPKAKEFLEELIQIIQPKHIIALGVKPFDALRGKSKVELKVEPNFKFSYHKGIPLAYIPNPSPMCRRYYIGDKIRLWQNILVKFLGDELRK